MVLCCAFVIGNTIKLVNESPLFLSLSLLADVSVVDRVTRTDPSVSTALYFLLPPLLR